MKPILLSNCWIPASNIVEGTKGYFSVFTDFNPETGEFTPVRYHYNPSFSSSVIDAKKFDSFDKLKEYLVGLTPNP